ncbi:MAG TPA: hypothetical protein V6D25_18670 [Leptolyngbyaceae cyanobacterium]
MTDFLMVDVASVTSNVSRSNFKELDLDILADKILESGGIIKPLILKEVGFEKYEVIDGHFEYYAAVKAKEKNPSEAEMVNALIVTLEKEEAVLKQAHLLKAIKTDGNQLQTVNVNKQTATDLSSSGIQEFETLNKQIDHLALQLAQESKERQKLYEYIKVIEKQIPKQITPLEAFNNLNIIDLTFRLRTSGFTDKKAVQVVESIDKERKKKKFDSLKDVVERVTIANGKKRVKGISSDKMVDIVDTWSRVLFT